MTPRPEPRRQPGSEDPPSQSALARQAHPKHDLAQAYALAARVVAGVLNGANLNDSLAIAAAVDAALRAAAQELAYGTLRAWGSADVIVRQLLDKPLRDETLRALLLVALLELRRASRAKHTVVDQAVRGAVLLNQSAARGLVNAVLRNYLRGASDIEARLANVETARFAHPPWWIGKLKTAYPAQWQSILEVSNTHPPMTLRINRRRGDVDGYLRELEREGLRGRFLGHDAIVLERPMPVTQLPGFDAGRVSVQDAGAQHAARVLDVQPGMRVLDACAAPGGKTGHILEIVDCELVAMDISAERARRIKENLRRLGLVADVREGDCLTPESSLADQTLFQRILLDAPCSASGVSRRHPDIRWLRRASDLGKFSRVQARMLAALWPLLAPGGKLLYTTCSVFSVENETVIENFLQHTPDAAPLETPDIPGGMLLPTADNDGFFHALMRKQD